MGRRRRDLLWWPAELREGIEFSLIEGAGVWMPARRVCYLEHGEWSEQAVDLLPGYALVGSTGRPPKVIGGTLLGKPLSQKEVTMLRANEQVSEFRPVGEFINGQPVAVRQNVKSAYAGMVAVFLSIVPMCGGYFAKVDVDLYGDARTVMLPLDYLEV